MKHLFALNKYFRKYFWHIALGVCFVSLYRFCSILIPQTIRDALDFIFQKIEEDNITGVGSDQTFMDLYGSDILVYSGKVVGFALIMGVFMYLMRQTVIVMSRLVEYDIRKEIYAHYQELHQAFFKKNKTGDLMSRITEDVSKVRMYLGPALLYSMNLVALFIIVIIAMVQVSPTLSLYTLLPLPFLSVSIYYVSRIINKRSEIIQIQLASLTSISQEVYSGIRVAKAYGKTKRFVSFFDDESEIFKNKSLDLALINALFIPLMILLVGLSTLLTIYMGGVLVSKGEITHGNIAEFVIYVNYLTWPFASIGWIASLIQQADASQKRINEFLNTEPAIKNSNYETYPIRGKIEFKEVSFVYENSGIKALQNISFTLPAGEKIAIVGLTASGKSTIADLILRTNETSEGQIYIDDKAIEEHNLSVLRRSIGYVPQDVFLFSDTIEKNIKFGDASVTDEAVIQMTKNVDVYKDIMSFPEKFDTMVGERGVTLSGGQKQRIAIARALVKEPQIVILDDALSAVDTQTEKNITDFLENSQVLRTTILITHRLNSLVDYNHILVMDEGKIIERGSHEELIAQNGQYAEMFAKQKFELVSE